MKVIDIETIWFTFLQVTRFNIMGIDAENSE